MDTLWLFVLFILFALIVYVTMPNIDSTYKAGVVTHIWAIGAASLILLFPNTSLIGTTVAVTLLAFHSRSIVDDYC